MNTLGRYRVLLLLSAMMLLGVGAWFGRKAYRNYTNHKFIAQARQHMTKSEWQQAALCLTRAQQADPTSAELADAIADFLEAQNNRAALTFRINAARLAPTRTEYRLAWAKTALSLSELRSCKEALDGVEQAHRETAEFHKMAGALAWTTRDYSQAMEHYSAAQRLEPTNQTILLNLATIQAASTNAATAAAGVSRLEQLAAIPQLRLEVFRELATISVAKGSLKTMVDYRRKVVECPGSTYGDRIELLRGLHAAQASDYESFLAGLEREAATNSFQAFNLGRWMFDEQNPTNTLSWLKSLPSSTTTNQPVPMLMSDCFVSLKDWGALLECIKGQDWAEVEYYRLSFECLAHTRLKADVAAQAAWQKALKVSSHRLDRLSRLAELTTLWGLEAESVDALREITAEFPNESWAATELTAVYYKEGNTAALVELLGNIYAADPTDTKCKSRLANVSLLRKADLERAHRLAREAYASEPDNPFFASTYAYSLLLQNRSEEAASVVGNVKTNFLQIPSVAAYYGLVQARAGHKDLARGPLGIASRGQLLPEEKQLVQTAVSQL